jgi:MarR family transcriptional regulator, temperature-dependent positive regulator of motility
VPAARKARTPITPMVSAAPASAPTLEIATMPGHLIRRLQQASVAIFDNEIRRAGFDLTPVQFAALTMIGANPGLDQASLAQGIAYDRVTIGGVVDRLEAKGLLRREIAETDRRARKLYLQPMGKTVLDQVRPVVRAVQGAILQGLDADESAVLSSLLRKALDAVGDVSRTPLRPRTIA